MRSWRSWHAGGQKGGRVSRGSRFWLRCSLVVVFVGVSFVSFVSFVPAEASAGEPPVVESGAVSVEPEAPRPKAFEALTLHPPAPVRHVDLGVALSLLSRQTSAETTDGATSVRYPSALGLSISARVDVLRYLRAGVYVMRHVRDMEIADGALGLPGDPGVASVHSYSLGFRLAPTWPISARARLWASAGVGWGRTEIGRFSVVSPLGSFEVRERSSSHLEWPLGLGFSFDLIPSWLAVELEVSGAVFTGERGDALRSGQAIDASGHVLRVSPFPSVEATFVQTLGLALLL